MIEENGFNLSGGQRQRIVMARSLIKDFDILIIDEALNQLDIYSEKKILSSIFNYYPSKTIIFITHRLNNCNMLPLYNRATLKPSFVLSKNKERS